MWCTTEVCNIFGHRMEDLTFTCSARALVECPLAENLNVQICSLPWTTTCCWEATFLFVILCLDACKDSCQWDPVPASLQRPAWLPQLLFRLELLSRIHTHYHFNETCTFEVYLCNVFGWGGSRIWRRRVQICEHWRRDKLGGSGHVPPGNF